MVCDLQTEEAPVIAPGCAGGATIFKQVYALELQAQFAFTQMLPDVLNEVFPTHLRKWNIDRFWFF